MIIDHAVYNIYIYKLEGGILEYCDVITKDILIIQCPFNKRAGIGNVFPLGIGYLMKALEENGNSFDFYDCAYITEKVDDCSITEVLQKLSLFLERQTYKIISISGVTTGAILSLRSIVNVCRKCAPMSKLIIGGPLPSIKETVKVFFANYSIDGIMRGDGEDVLPAFISHIKSGNSVESFYGITTESKMGPLNILHDINRIPIPYRDTSIMSRYGVSRKRRLFSKKKSSTIITSRGCPCNCFYCVSGNSRSRKFVKRSWDNIADEIQMLVNEYDVDNIVFYDDCFFPNKKLVNDDVDKFLSEIERVGCKGRFFWQVELRADVVANMSKKSLQEMYIFGCRQINLGIETSDPDFLKYLGKTVSVEDVYTACDNIRNFTPKMIMGGTFIVGGPNVNEEAVLQTAKYAKNLKLHFVNFFPLELHPGTPLYRDIYGDSDEWYQTIIHHKNNSQCLLYENPNFPEMQLKKAVEKAYDIFYDITWENRMAVMLGDEYKDIWGVLSKRNEILARR